MKAGLSGGRGSPLTPQPRSQRPRLKEKVILMKTMDLLLTSLLTLQPLEVLLYVLEKGAKPRLVFIGPSYPAC